MPLTVIISICYERFIKVIPLSKVQTSHMIQPISDVISICKNYSVILLNDTKNYKRICYVGIDSFLSF